MEPDIYLKMWEVEESHWWFKGRRKILKKTLLSLSLPKEVKILDYGCGTGGNLNFLSEFGEVTGIDPSEKAIKIAKRRNNGQILKGSFPDDIPFDYSTFDLIVMLDVLEHIEYPLDIIEKVHYFLKPGGWVLLTVPAMPWLWSNHDDIHHHKRRYTYSSLRNNIEDSSLKIEFISYYNTFLFPIIAVTRLISKLFPSKSKKELLEIPAPFLNSLLAGIFSSEYYFLRKITFPFGSSLLAILKKEQ